MDEEDDDEEERRYRNRLYRRIHAIAAEAGITRPDRIDLAVTLLGLQGAEIASLSDLEIDELEILAAVFRGWQLIQGSRFANGHLEAEARVVLKQAKSAR